MLSKCVQIAFDKLVIAQIVKAALLDELTLAQRVKVTLDKLVIAQIVQISLDKLVTTFF